MEDGARPMTYRGRASLEPIVIVIEGDGSTNYSAYAPDLPGVAATGTTLEECNDTEAVTVKSVLTRFQDPGREAKRHGATAVIIDG